MYICLNDIYESFLANNINVLTINCLFLNSCIFNTDYNNCKESETSMINNHNEIVSYVFTPF